MEITTEAKRKKKLSEYEAHLRVSWQKRYRPPSWWSRTTQITFSLFLKSNLSDLSSPSSLSVWLLTDVANDVYSHFLESISHISYRPRLGSFSLEHKRLPVEDAGVLAFSLLNYLRRGKSFLLVNFCLTIWGELFFLVVVVAVEWDSALSRGKKCFQFGVGAPVSNSCSLFAAFCVRSRPW